MKLPSISRRGGIAATLSALLAATALATMAPSQALDPAGVGPRDSTRAGFPAYYTDDSNVALQLCVDGTAKCGGATVKSDGAGGPGIGVSPDGEGFYFLATSSISEPGLSLDIEFAAEAAWMARGQQATFDRVRIRGHSDSAGDILVNTPYGDFTVTADPPLNAQSRNVNMTEDIGCPIAPCDFRRMASHPLRHITSWITANGATGAYLGNGVSAQPANVAGTAATWGAGGTTTDRWVIIGKKAPANRASLPSVLNFGNAARVANRSVNMRNLGTASRTISKVTVKGSKHFRKLATSTCKAGTVLAPGKACRVDVRFSPGARPFTATLTITDNIGAHNVRLKGR